MPVVLVTGSSRGIGLSVAEKFASEGWSVYAAMRDPAGADALLSRTGGMDVRVLPLDVADPAAVEDAFGVVRQEAPSLDVVVNNAAVFPVGPLERTSADEVVRAVSTNLVGPMLVARSSIPLMREQHSGVLLNVSSLAGRPRLGPPLAVVYNTTKAALVSMSYELAKELTPLGIRVHALELGAWSTQGVQGIGSDVAKLPADDAYAGPSGRLRSMMKFLLRVMQEPSVAAQAIYQVAVDPPRAVRVVIPAEQAASANDSEKLSDAQFLELCAMEDPSQYVARYNQFIGG